jgi:hypothetical protein
MRKLFSVIAQFCGKSLSVYTRDENLKRAIGYYEAALPGRPSGDSTSQLQRPPY